MVECVRLEQITKSYGKRCILNGVNLTVEKGELIAIKGKSGSGKSTLLNIIGQLDSYDKGYMYFENRLIKRNIQRNVLRSEKIGFVFQSYCLMENLSVMDNVLMPFLYSDIRLSKDTKMQCKKLLDTFGLANLQRQKVKNLSGGEKQRVAIVRAIIRKPELIVADEPTGNLDADNSNMVSSLLREYAQQGNSVIVVTHSDSCFNNADKIYHLKDGVLV